MPLREILKFNVSFLQILDDEGRSDEKLEPKLSSDELLQLYRWMTLTREVDQRMLKLQRQGRVGTFPLNTGQEATICGATFAMTEQDWFVPSYRELGGRLMRGEPIATHLRYWNGYEEGNVWPKKGRTLPITVVIGTQLLHAVGIGYAMRYRGEDQSAVVTFIGDGGTSEGDFHEALNFAGAWQAPVVFICVNNQWAISQPRDAQTRSHSIAQKAIAYGFEGIQVDGNDPLAVYKATKAALERARAGGGPTLIEAMTYRLLMHTTADDPTRYRQEKEVEDWWKRDPLPRFRKYLERKKFWSDEKETELQEKIRTQVEEAVQSYESDFPIKPDSCFDHIWGAPHEQIEEQRAMFLDYLARHPEDKGAH